VHPIRNAVGSKRINARIVSRPERGFAACHRHLGHACDGKLKWGRGRDAENAILHLPSPTVFGRNRRSDRPKTGPSCDTEVIDEAKFRYNTGKIGSPKNKLPLPAP
jgi:hypothetical protein